MINKIMPFEYYNYWWKSLNTASTKNLIDYQNLINQRIRRTCLEIYIPMSAVGADTQIYMKKRFAIKKGVLPTNVLIMLGCLINVVVNIYKQ